MRPAKLGHYVCVGVTVWPSSGIASRLSGAARNPLMTSRDDDLVVTFSVPKIAAVRCGVAGIRFTAPTLPLPSGPLPSPPVEHRIVLYILRVGGGSNPQCWLANSRRAAGCGFRGPGACDVLTHL